MMHGVLFGLTVGLAIIASSMARTLTGSRAGHSGPIDRMTYPRFIPGLAVAVAAIFVAASTRGLVADHDVRWLIILSPGVLAILVFLPVLVSSEVRISDGVLSGPGIIVGPFQWFNRNSIKLADIAAVGSKHGYAFYESVDGTRVYVSRSYPQSGAFLERLDAMRN